jgi:hypothetical protein
MILLDETKQICPFCKRKMKCSALEVRESSFCRRCAKKRLAEAKAQGEPREWSRDGKFLRLIPAHQIPA